MMHLLQRLRSGVLTALVAVPLLVTPLSAQLVSPVGSSDSFDLATWNLKTFPLSSQTANVVAVMIGDLQLDLYGFQEIQDELAFSQMASNAGGYSSLASAEEDGYNRFGIVYNSSKVSLTGAAYPIWSSTFTRRPFVAPVRMVEAGDSLEFNFAVLHLKAFDSGQSQREAEIAALKSFIDTKLSQGDSNWVVVGDWNDELDDPDDDNIFMPLLDDPDYHFLSMEMVGVGYYNSWIGSSQGSLIDHIMVTTPMLARYGDAGQSQTLRLDDEYDLYTSRVSDHRPVASLFPAGTNAVPESGGARPTLASLELWPVPANATVRIGWELVATQRGELAIFDLLGRKVFDRELNGSQGAISWNANAIPSGSYIVRLSGEAGQAVTRRAVILR